MAIFRDIRVDDRVIKGERMWVVTGVHMGAIGQENLISMRPVDLLPGSAYGKTVNECTVPEDMIDPAWIFRRVGHDAENRITSIALGQGLGPESLPIA